MSSDEILIVGKLLLTFGVLLGLPVWELVRLGRERRRDDRRRSERQRPARRRENLASSPAVKHRTGRASGQCS